jgi:integrase
MLVEVLVQQRAVMLPEGVPSPWMFPVMDSRRKDRFTDRRGRLQPMAGDRRSPNTNFFGKCLKRALEEAKITRRVTVHGLRRTFAVLLQDVGAPDWVIAQAMGHAERGVTARHYLPRREEVLQEWVDKIDLDQLAGPVVPPDEIVFEESYQEPALGSAPYVPPVGGFPGAN